MEKDVCKSISKVYLENFLSLKNLVLIYDILIEKNFNVNLEINGKYCEDIEKFKNIFQKGKTKTFAIYFSEKTETITSRTDGSLTFLERRIRLFVNQSTRKAKAIECQIEEEIKKSSLKPKAFFSPLTLGLIGSLFFLSILFYRHKNEFLSDFCVIFIFLALPFLVCRFFWFFWWVCSNPILRDAEKLEKTRKWVLYSFIFIGLPIWGWLLKICIEYWFI